MSTELALKENTIVVFDFEIWKDIPEYEGYYQASNLGRLKSMRRTIKGNGNSFYFIKEIILKTKIDNMGYFFFRLCKNSKQKCFKLHRLIAMAFIPNPENKPCVNHINGIKTDNRVENLEWVTYSENTKHAFLLKLMENKKGEQSKCAKFNNSEIDEIFRLSKLITQKNIAKRFNVSEATISRIINKKRYN